MILDDYILIFPQYEYEGVHAPNGGWNERKNPEHEGARC